MTDVFAPQPQQPPGPGPQPIPGTPLAGGAPRSQTVPPPAPPQHAQQPQAVQFDTGYPVAAHELMAKHHNVHGGLDIQLRRLGELAGAHAAVIAHLIEHAGQVTAAGGPPGFLDRIVEAMKANQGSLRLIEQAGEELLVQHAGVIAAVERFL